MSSFARAKMRASSTPEAHGYSLANTRLTKTDKAISGGLDHETINAIEGQHYSRICHFISELSIVKVLRFSRPEKFSLAEQASKL